MFSGICCNGGERIIGLHVCGQWRRCGGYSSCIVIVALLSTTGLSAYG